MNLLKSYFLSCSTLLALAALIVVIASSLHAQGTDAKAIRRIEVPIPMGSGLIYPTSAGRYVVCVQNFSEASDVDGKQVAPCVRLVVVDLAARRVIAQEDLPSGEYRFGACDDYVLMADRNAKQVVVKSIQDLAERKRFPTTATIERFLVVPQKLICTADGSLRIDYQSLEPSTQWQSLGTKGQTLPIAQYHDGWLIDGVLWNKTLEQPLLLLGFPHRKDFEMGLDPWEKEAKGRKVSLDYPIAARLEANAEVKVKIETLSGALMSELSAGPLVVGAGNVGGLVTWQNTSDPSEQYIQVALMKNRLYLTNSSRLLACDLSSLGLEKLPKPFEIVRQQSQFTMPYGTSTKFRHEYANASTAELEMKLEQGPATKVSDNEFEIDLKAYMSSRPKSNDYDYAISRKQQNLRERLPELLKRLAINHDGPLFPERVWATAISKNVDGTEQRATLGYYALSTISADDYKKFLEQKGIRDQENAARSKLQAERLEKERLAKVAQDQRQQTIDNASRSAGSIFRIIRVLATLLVLPAACVLPIFALGLRLEPRGKMKISYLTALIASLPLALCAYQFIVTIGKLPNQPMPWVPIPPMFYFQCLVGSAVFMIAAFALAALLVLFAKKQVWLWILGLGLLGPIGYIITLLLPTGDKQPPASSDVNTPPRI